MFALLLTATTAQAFWPENKGTVTLTYDSSISASDQVLLDWAQDTWDTGPHDLRLLSISGNNGDVKVDWAAPGETTVIMLDPNGDTLWVSLRLDPDLDLTRSNAFTELEPYGGDHQSFKAYALERMAVALSARDRGPYLTESILFDWERFSALSNTTAYPQMGPAVLGGLVDHHGEKSSPIIDVGVLHVELAPFGSTHSFTEVHNLSYQPVTTAPGALGVPVAKVPAGHTVRAEFLLTNNGVDWEYPEWDLYLSDNVNITTSDRLIGTTGVIQPGIAPLEAETEGYSVDLPADVSGLKYLGIAIDVSGDTNATNDESWLPIEIVANGDDDLCSFGVPCKRGYGDCDSSAECEAGTTCRWNVGANYGFNPLTDVCE